jgi:hypothetical protein
VYQSVVPQEDFASAGEYLARLREQSEKMRQQGFQTTGTPAEMAVRQAGTRMAAAGTYSGSLPRSDKYLKQTTGGEDPYAYARTAAEVASAQSVEDYKKALEKIGEKPGRLEAEGTPSWALPRA